MLEKLKYNSTNHAETFLGNAGICSLIVAEELGKALRTFKDSKPLYLHQIDVVVFDSAMLSDFEDALGDIAPVTSAVKKVCFALLLCFALFS